MNDREMDDLMIFAYTTASVRARREQAKAIRHGLGVARDWLAARWAARRNRGKTLATPHGGAHCNG